MENTVKLSIGRKGYHGMWEIRNELNQFVKENYSALFEGAARLDLHRDPGFNCDWTRVYVGKTRLHERVGLKYADGHKYDSSEAPTEEQLRQTIADIQRLIDAYQRDIPRPFILTWQ